MKTEVVLTLTVKQSYPGQETQTIEFVTDGFLEIRERGCSISYEESVLTGLESVHTEFFLEDGCVTLIRTGKLQSKMVFREGISHESLYQMEFGALMISVCAQRVSWKLNEYGGTVVLKYQIDIENTTTGTVDYHLKVKRKD